MMVFTLSNPFTVLLAASLALAPISEARAIARADELVDCLQSSLSPQGSVVVPNDPTFANDTVRFSTYDVPTWRVVARVFNEDDVRASISCATKTDTDFLFTGTRHGFSSEFDTDIQNGLEILTEGFDGITVDAAANTMTVQGAVRFKDVANALQAAGKNIPVGSGPCVGIVGASLGGGIGKLQGLYGLILDSLLSVNIMLPNTTVVEASQEKYSDLFWGIRGAGFNFGFILNATYRVYDLVPGGEHFNADFQYPSNVTGALFKALKQEAKKMPAPLCISTTTSWTPAYNQTTIIVNAVYAGPEDEGRKSVKFLKNLGPVLRQNSSMVPWNKLFQNSFFINGSDAVLSCQKPGGRRNVYAVALNEVDVDAQVKAIDQFNSMFDKYPFMKSSVSSMYFCAKQGVEAIPVDSTAYPWRHAIAHETWAFVYPNATLNDNSIGHIPDKIRSIVADTAGTDGLKAYVGFSNGDEPLESIFSKEHLPRLAALKKQYDPSELFSNYHPLPLSYP